MYTKVQSVTYQYLLFATRSSIVTKAFFDAPDCFVGTVYGGFFFSKKLSPQFFSLINCFSTYSYTTNMSTLYKAAELVKTKSNDRKSKDKRINKQRVMMLSSRGVTFR